MKGAPKPIPSAERLSKSNRASGSVRTLGFIRSLGASLGVHGAVFVALVIALPLGFLTWGRQQKSQPTGHVIAMGPVLNEPAPFAEVPPEEAVPETQAESLPEPELIDVPWTRFVKRFGVEEERFEDPLGRPPVLELAWTLVQPPGVAEEPMGETAVLDDVPDPVDPEELIPDSEENRASGARKPISTPSPSYPRAAIQRGQEGSVVCELHVSASGKVTHVEVVQSSGYELLDSAAKKALGKWVFEPSEADEGAEIVLRHDVVFRLDEKS